MHILTVSWSFENLLRNKQRIQCQNSGVPPRKSLRTKQSSDPSAWTAAQTTSPLPPSPKNTSSLNLQRNKYQFLTFDNLLQSSKKSHPLGSHQPLQTKTHLNQDPRITIPMSKLGRNRIKERRKKKKKPFTFLRREMQFWMMKLIAIMAVITVATDQVGVSGSDLPSSPSCILLCSDLALKRIRFLKLYLQRRRERGGGQSEKGWPFGGKIRRKGLMQLTMID